MKGLFQCPPWEWVKDPPAGEGQVGQIQHCRAVTFSLRARERLGERYGALLAGETER